MNVLRVMLKHVGYYVLVWALISLFAAVGLKRPLTMLCGAALSVSMFSTVIQLLIDGSVGMIARRISTWCLRGTAVVTAIAIIAGIGIHNIVRVFTG